MSPASAHFPSIRRRAASASVVDLFCGAGGLSHGFVLEGVPVVLGIDMDEACGYPFERNNGGTFAAADVSGLSGDALKDAFTPGAFRILAGCAPCQPFSTYTQARRDTRRTLVGEFARMVEETRPDVVAMENVRRLRMFDGGSLLADFERRLASVGYDVSVSDVDCADYGVPQSRKRLVVLASRHGPLALGTSPSGVRATVRDAIAHLPPLRAGETDGGDPLHASARLSDVNSKRIRASRPGGTWRDWPEELRLACHRRKTGEGYASVYGRMSWDEPSPTVTTQFYGFGSGRFGHPEQDRALTLREGALLQSFPDGYRFVPEGGKANFGTVGRLIGNAVPVALGRAIARAVMAHLESVVR